MGMVGRQYSAGGQYRYGFNGQEKSAEIILNSTTAEFWQYDARVGRRWNLDPKSSSSIRTFGCFINNPIYNSDPLGDTTINGEYFENCKNGGQLEGAIVRAKLPKEGASKTYHGPYFDVTSYYHRASKTFGTSGGWMQKEFYIKSLSVDIGKGSPGYFFGMTSGDARLTPFMGGTLFLRNNPAFVQNQLLAYFDEIGDPEEIFFTALYISAFNTATESRFNSSGYCQPSSFNVEDLTGLAILAKQGIKMFISKLAAVKGETETLSLLTPTHYLTRSRSKMEQLIEDIRINGIKEPLEFVEHSGQKFIVNGNHRYFAARKLGIKQVPVKQVHLPIGCYRNQADLLMEGKMPGYWKYIK